MSTSVWLMAITHDLAPLATVRSSSPPDPSCNVSEVTRLLWTMIVLAAATGVAVVVRPSWRWVAGLAGAALVWTWIDMEGPVLVARGTHGLHVADVPVVIALVAVAAATFRLLRWRSRRPARSDV